MIYPRAGQRAVGLADGRVLAFGCFSDACLAEAFKASWDTAELWDPATERWSGSVGPPGQWEAVSVTRLSDDRLLGAGGLYADLFDPASGLWTATGMMTEHEAMDCCDLIGRNYHLAVLLANGQVLAAGGQDYNSALSSAELFDPKTGRWSPTGNMVAAADDFFSALDGNWSRHAALTHDGLVLLAGSLTERTAVQLYDPLTGTWAATAPLPSVFGSADDVLSLPDGRVVALGGGSIAVYGGW
jgi:hypothetical protein